MRREEIEALCAEGSDAVAAVIAGLEGRIEELERRVGRDSSNSSLPPSLDAPKSRAERRRAAREAYKRSMRKSGGQPGHEGKTRELAVPERIDERLVHLPERCGCGHEFDGSEQRLGDPVVHQQYELPVIRPLVIEHCRVRLGCPGCGRASLAELPGPALAGFGARLDAHIAMLAGVFRLSREDVRLVVVEVFGVPASTGAIDSAIMRMSAVMADPWTELRAAIHKAEVIHADETTWRLAGAQQWLWVAASALLACYRIDPSRSQAAAKALLGEDFGGFVVTDRYAGYHFLDVFQQQLCWCHAIRQLVEVSQRPGATGRRGTTLVKLARQVIAAHRTYLTSAPLTGAPSLPVHAKGSSLPRGTGLPGGGAASAWRRRENRRGPAGRASPFRGLDTGDDAAAVNPSRTVPVWTRRAERARLDPPSRERAPEVRSGLRVRQLIGRQVAGKEPRGTGMGPKRPIH